MNDDRAFERALDQALDQLAAGEPLAAVLARHPAGAAALEPLLQVAVLARAGLAGAVVPPPDLARGRQRFLASAVRPRPLWERASPRQGVVSAIASGWHALSAALTPLRLALATLLVFLALVGAGAASADALPGDGLYPVKRALETARLAVTFQPAARQALAAELAARRRQEAAQVLTLGREVALGLEGTVDATAPGQLIVSGLVLLTPDAGLYVPGDEVAVEARATRDGRLLATRITLLRPAPQVPNPTPTRPATASSAPPRSSPTPVPATPVPTRLPPTLPPATRPADATPSPAIRLATETPGTLPSDPPPTSRPATQRPTEPAAATPVTDLTRPAADTARPQLPSDTPTTPPTARPQEPTPTPPERPSPTSARRP